MTSLTIFPPTCVTLPTILHQALVESMLNLILQLVYQRMYMGLSEERMVHLEVVTKLTMGDFTHSQLTDNLPEKPGISELTGSYYTI